ESWSRIKVKQYYRHPMLSFIRKFIIDQKGVTAIEYGMIGMALATGLAIIMGNNDTGFISALSSLYESIAIAF
ncbi:Flp family type IVb pilin, partial [Vibrio breoganii]|uniref:Flp family type IVb pilin n=2 Tax=Vibrio breoganii TaxID=553239 RepID=UPI001F53B754